MWRNPRRLRPPGGCPRAPALPPQGTAHCSNLVTVTQRHPANFFPPVNECGLGVPAHPPEQRLCGSPSAAGGNARLGPGRQPASTAEHADHRRSPRGAREAGPRERRSPHQRHRRRGLAILAWHRPRVGGQPPARRGPRLAARPAPHRTGTPPRQTGASRTLSQGPRGNWTCTTHPYPQPP